VLAWARQRGLKRLGLRAPVHSPAAIALYRQAGFHETGRRRPLPTNPSLQILEAGRGDACVVSAGAAACAGWEVMQQAGAAGRLPGAWPQPPERPRARLRLIDAPSLCSTDHFMQI
jgi:hypothetical protein